MLRYRKGDMRRLRRASGHLRPGDAVLGTLAAEGILQYRGKRADRNLQRPIAIIDSTLNSDRRATRQRRRRRRAARPRGRNVNNLIRPQLMRHVFRPTSLITCGTLNARSLRNKVDAVDDLMRAEGLDVLGITESWHEDSGDVCIDRLRAWLQRHRGGEADPSGGAPRLGGLHQPRRRRHPHQVGPTTSQDRSATT